MEDPAPAQRLEASSGSGRTGVHYSGEVGDRHPSIPSQRGNDPRLLFSERVSAVALRRTWYPLVVEHCVGDFGSEYLRIPCVRTGHVLGDYSSRMLTHPVDRASAFEEP